MELTPLTAVSRNNNTVMGNDKRSQDGNDSNTNNANNIELSPQ